MKIGVFCTNEYTTPPPHGVIYAPLVVTQQIADGLAKRGHSVTIYAPKGSHVKSKLFTNDTPSLYKNPQMKKFIALNKERAVGSYEQLALSTLIKHAQEGKFDILHIHPSIRGIFYSQLVKTPIAFTLHDPIIQGKKFFYKKIHPKNAYYISISKSQRKPAPELNWAGTVYNGTDLKKFPFNAKPGKHFVTYGRLTETKGMHEAIMAAKKARIPLQIAGGPASGPYWERKIKPHLTNTIKHVGMIPYTNIPEFVSRAKGFLFPIKWEEPFGLVMTEAMATGTPVIAFPRGSVKEIIKDKKTGFIVRSVSEMASAMKKIDQIDRKACRDHVEKNFGIEKMIDGYERIFTRIVKQHHGKKNN